MGVCSTKIEYIPENINSIQSKLDYGDVRTIQYKDLLYVNKNSIKFNFDPPIVEKWVEQEISNRSLLYKKRTIDIKDRNSENGFDLFYWSITDGIVS